MTAHGTTDARTQLMRAADARGELDPAIAAVLDNHQPGWRTDPLDTAWAQTFTDYRDWDRRHRRAPENHDGGAAGLRPWLDAQLPIVLTVSRRRALESLRGWTAGIDGKLAWPLVIALHQAGVRPSRAADKRVIGWLVNHALATGHTAASNVPKLSGVGPQMLSLALFCARNQRLPRASEPGGRFLRNAARGKTSRATAAVLDQLGKWRSR
jgi:hypothetical protein